MADPERVQLRQNYFIFMENFQKNLRKLINNQVKLTNQTPLYKFEPPIKKSGMYMQAGLSGLHM